MISESRKYLIDKIRAAMGQQTKVCTTMKELKLYSSSHVAAVLIEADINVFNGSKSNIQTTRGVGKSTKLYDREVRFNVVLSEYKLETLEPIFEAFIKSLDRYIVLSDTYCAYIELGQADWVEKDDSILKAEVSVEMQIVFKGGIYKEHTLGTVSKIEITQEVPISGR